MKDYVVDLEIARELKENGFSQNSIYRYEIDIKEDASLCQNFIPINDHVNYVYSAPCSDEILKELPKRISYHQNLCIIKDEQTYWCAYEGATLEDEVGASSKKLSNALAKLYIRLKKEGYIK